MLGLAAVFGALAVLITLGGVRPAWLSISATVLCCSFCGQLGLAAVRLWKPTVRQRRRR